MAVSSYAQGYLEPVGVGGPQRDRSLYIPPPLLAAAAAACALASGFLIADGHVGIGIALVLAVIFGPVAFFNLPVALAMWVVVLFIEGIPALSIGPTAVEVLVPLVAIGAAGSRRGRLPVLSEHRWLLGIMLAFASWVTLSIAWAQDAGAAASTAGDWWLALIAFVVAASAMASSRDVRMFAFAFVGGAVLSVIVGFLGIGNTTNPLRAAKIGTRLTGGGIDPNDQAAGYLAALFLAGGLTGLVRTRTQKLGLLGALALITVGFLATESRGGLVGLVVSGLAAFVLLPQYRRRILASAVVVATGIAVWLAVQPSALARLTNFSGGGSGRVDLWTIAWRIFKGHPLVGIGINNFPSAEPHYTLVPGPLTALRYVVDTPLPVHNTYLGLLAETGIIGFGLFALLVIVALRSNWLAALRFDKLGRPGEASLARAGLVGAIAMLVAMFFITWGTDQRMWLLFALGPVLLTISNRERLEPVVGRRRTRQRAPYAARSEPEPEPPADVQETPVAPALEPDEESLDGSVVSWAPPDEEALLSLLIYHRMSYSEIASMLGMDEADVRARARPALRRISPTAEQNFGL